MHISDEILKLERRLSKASVSVNAVCRKAEIDRSTWHRWKAGESSPNTTTWDKAFASAEALIVEARNQKAGAV